MPFNGSGTFTRIYSWVTDAANSIAISASRTDAEMNGFAAGLSNCVTRDGQSPPSADLPMGGKKLTNLGLATTSTDALSQAAGDARYLSIAGGWACAGTATFAGTLNIAGTTLWVNTNKLLIQHDGTTGFVRSQTGDLWLGAAGTTTLKLDAAGNATITGVGNLTVPGTITMGGSTLAVLASPAFTGNPTAPTQSTADNSAKLATTAYVQANLATRDTSIDALKDVPQNAQTAAYTLALTDRGKHVSITTGGVIIPANASVAFPIGATVGIYNNSGSSQTISITSDTLTLAGTATTGSRTLAQHGFATLIKVSATAWVILGAGVT